MLRRRTVLLFILPFFALFAVTTIYLLIVLQSSESKVRKPLSIEEKIYQELKLLPVHYKNRPLVRDRTTDLFLNSIKENREKWKNYNLSKIWNEANSWVSAVQLVNMSSPFLGPVFFALKFAKILKADIDTRGTQLKLLLTLEGNQQVVFKPKWYSKEHVIEGPVYAGKDRYGSEIIGFYLSLILKRYLTPISVERKVSLKHEILPVATTRLLNTMFEKDGRTCVFGKCFYCRKEDPVCEDENFLLTGAVIFNINNLLRRHRSPWQRTYKEDKKAVWQQYPESYCKTVRQKLPKKRLNDLMDVSIFDFLIQNGDRHHYETVQDTLIWLDNGKGLGNPYINHLDILAPFYQCCVLRRQTWETLKGLTGGVLTETLESMPDSENFLTKSHMKAIEERLLIIFASVEYCNHQKQNNVL